MCLVSAVVCAAVSQTLDGRQYYATPVSATVNTLCYGGSLVYFVHKIHSDVCVYTLFGHVMNK